ncbi:MAG TPA: PPE family protein, partial [Mycobacterium sp.]|nr:PPE family protein [Mycobacterium sp.]
MDFAFLPPEINSARMYTGPGPGSLLAAAGSWDALAAELGTTAETYESVVSGLTTLHWRGPASELMMATAAPYVSWLYTTAEQTRQTAMQAGAAATAFEQAYAMTVPPAVVTANRMQLMVLIATNFFGQNTAAIAATEAQYAEMWAQDAAAMSGYATASAAATTLTPFSSPKQTTNPAGLAAQTAAVAQADANAATADPVSSVISSAAQALPPLLPTFNPELGFLDIIAGSYSTLSAVRDMEGTADGIILGEKNLGLLPDLSKVAAEVAPALPALQQSAGAASGLGGGAGLPNAVLASVARANSIGPLSVPASWSAPSTRA